MMGGFLTWVRAEWDRVAGFGFLGLGALAVLLGYFGVSGTDDVPSQLSYLISGGLGGLVLVAVGATLLVTADLKDEWRKLDSLEARLAGNASISTPSRAGDGGVVANQWLVAVGSAVAVAILFAGWWSASGADGSAEGFRAASLGGGSAVLAGLVGVSHTVSIRRRVASRTAHLLAPLTALAPQLTPATSASTGRAPEDHANSGVLFGEGLTLFHRPHCLALRGIQAQRVPRAQVPQDLRPCQLCEAR